jgi:phenylpropionate dioxygenase-like ring-hydroxylating dioxygenase large terminal subunit
MNAWSDDASVVQRILDHIDRGATDESESCWREPVANYRSPERFAAELALLRRTPTPFCPSAALPQSGSYVAQSAAGTPVLAVRGADGLARAFRNACRHRGMLLAEGPGCAKAFVCRYHGWTYGLDGALRHVPHERGFPGLDRLARGLAPLPTLERHGVVWVTQDEAGDPERGAASLDAALIPQDLHFLGVNEQELAANWKILTEGFLEGYHIRSTHRETFYPVQYDNLNVVETTDLHRRIAFPYRNIEKLREVPPAQRRADGVLTYVTHVFPNVMVATFPSRILMVVLEPLAIDRTRLLTYALTDRDVREGRAGEAVKRSQDFVLAGALEDNAMACGIQRTLSSGANEFFEFGRFEGAIGHFHRCLHAALDAAR